MSDRLKRHFHELHTLNNCSKKQRKDYLASGSGDLIHCLCEICYNILLGNIPVEKNQYEKLKKHKNILRKLVAIQTKTKNKDLKLKRKIISQKGGFLPLILTPLLTIATDLLVNKLTEK